MFFRQCDCLLVIQFGPLTTALMTTFQQGLYLRGLISESFCHNIYVSMHHGLKHGSSARAEAGFFHGTGRSTSSPLGEVEAVILRLMPRLENFKWKADILWSHEKFPRSWRSQSVLCGLILQSWPNNMQIWYYVSRCVCADCNQAPLGNNMRCNGHLCVDIVIYNVPSLVWRRGVPCKSITYVWFMMECNLE